MAAILENIFLNYFGFWGIIFGDFGEIWGDLGGFLGFFGLNVCGKLGKIKKI